MISIFDKKERRMATGELIQQRGNYKNLISYKKSEVIFVLPTILLSIFSRKETAPAIK